MHLMYRSVKRLGFCFVCVLISSLGIAATTPGASVTGNPTYIYNLDGHPAVERTESIEEEGDQTVNVNVFAPGGLVARKQGGAWINYQFDQQGNVCQRLNASGTVLNSSSYDAYGSEALSGSTQSDPWAYNAQWGYVRDTDTGLYYCQNRWYDPATGRWLNRDPIGYSGGANLYAYCGGGPVGGADPDGLAKIWLRQRGKHTYLIVEDETTGERWSIAGGPTGGGYRLWGETQTIDTFFGPFGPGLGNYDYEEDCDENHLSQLILDDEKSAERWKTRLTKLGKKLEDDQVIYRLLGPNSNTFVRTILELIGYPLESAPAGAPGWGEPWPRLLRTTVVEILQGG